MDELPLVKTSLEETLQTIDGSIEKYQKAMDDILTPLLALKLRRNGLVPIGSLPYEILGAIFSLIQDRELNALGKRKGDPLKWISLTHVCRHWRNVALDMPNLWVDLPVRSRRWVREMLTRSKGHALVIDADIADSYVIQPGLELALKQIHRIRDLSLRLRKHEQDEWNHKFDYILRNPAPRLERLCLVCPEAPESDLFLMDDVLGNTERLRRLELSGCSFSWSTHPLLQRSLTHLKLRDVLHKFFPKGKEFMDVLHSMPELQLLDLKDSLPYSYDVDSRIWNSKPLHLRNLHTLRIENTFFDVNNFFHYVTFPPTATVKVIVHPEGDDESFSGTIEAVARSYSNAGPDVVFQSLSLQPSGPRNEGLRLKLFAQNIEGFDMVECMDAPAQLELILFCSVASCLRKILFTIVDSNIRLDKIRYIFLPMDIRGLAPAVLADTLGKLPSIRSVVLAENGAKTFFSAVLLGVACSPGRNEPDDPCFSRVSSLYLYRVPFMYPDVFRRTQNTTTTVSTEFVEYVLKERHRLRMPIYSLDLRQCPGITREDMEYLDRRPEVAIVWDEYIGELDESESEDEDEESE